MSIVIKKFEKIEKDTFEEEKSNANYIIINNEDTFSTSYYQYSIDDIKKIAFVCGDNYCPRIGITREYYILFYMGVIYFYSKRTYMLEKKYDNLIYVYDVLEYNNVIYIISETEVMALGSDLKIIVHKIYDDIIADYSLNKDKLYVRLDDGSVHEVLPY